MSFLNKLFGKKEKETLDQGLQKSKENFLSKITKAIAGKAPLMKNCLTTLRKHWLVQMWA